MDSQSSFKKVLNNSIIILSGSMGANILGLLSIAIFTHSMGAEIFGYYVLFLTYIEIIDRIFNFQTWQAFIKYATDFQVKNERHNILMLLKYSFLVDLISLTFAFGIAYLLVDVFIFFFDLPIEFKSLVVVLTTSLLFKIFEISTGIFRLFDEFRIQAQILVYVALLKLFLFGIVVIVLPSFENLVYATIIPNFAMFIMKFYYSKKILSKNHISLREIFKTKINYTLIKKQKIFSFIIYNNFDVAVRMVSRQLDVTILGKLYGPEIVGIFRIAKEMANLIARLTDPIYQAIYPEFAKLLANNRKLEVKKIAKKFSIYVGLASIVFYLLFIIFGKFAISLIFGEEFKIAYYITLIYFIAIFISIVTLPLYPMQHAFGLAKKAFQNQIYASLLYLIVVGILVLQYEMIGAALAYILYYIYLTGLTIKSVKKGYING